MTRPLAAILLTALLAGCGHAATPAAVAVRAASVAADSVAKPFDGPTRANEVLAYANAAARALDEHAAFVSLTGTQIEGTGMPGASGKWALEYVGGDMPAPAGQPVNPYMPWTRRITIVVAADGHARVHQSAQFGLPLGVSFEDSPMPAIDSPDVFRLFYAHQADPTRARATINQMTLTGIVGAHHFAQLVWRVGLQTTASQTPPMLMDANTGDVLDPLAD